MNQKYKLKQLTGEEVELIMAYMTKNESKNIKNILDIWIALQILIDIILENNYNGEELIININNKNSKNENIRVLYNLFRIQNRQINDSKDKKLFVVNSLMSIYYQFELFCWEHIKENLDEIYKNDIEEEVKNKFKNIFEQKNFKIINKKTFLKAIRRFISRYLLSKRCNNTFYENKKLIDFLHKPEFWEYDDKDRLVFESELKNIFNKNVIYVNQALKLYENIGEEEKIDSDYIEKDNKLKELYNSFVNSINFLIKSWSQKNKSGKKNNSINEEKVSNSLNTIDEKNRNSIGSSNSEGEESNNSFDKKSMDSSFDENEHNRNSLESKSDEQNNSYSKNDEDNNSESDQD